MKLNKGDAIMSFDIEAIKAAGYDSTVMVVVANSGDFKNLTTNS